jgi:four helix bundle suffix protein
MQPYKKLFTYWFAVVIYDYTVVFCERWIRSYKLTEQMTGAARSGKQNIVEGSDDMGTSLKTAIKLTGIAKGSFEELLGDVEDFLRQRKYRQWEKGDARVVRWRREYGNYISNLSVLRDLGRILVPKLPEQPETAANLLMTLLHQETYLLHRQVEALLKKHREGGGLTEKIYRDRVKLRSTH